MNFLAHCLLPYRHAPGDESLLLGNLLGDFVRGRRAFRALPVPTQQGILLHRLIDRFTDAAPPVRAFQKSFPRPFRRYAGIIMDVGFDHCLARDWSDWCDLPLDDFDAHVRDVLERHRDQVPDGLDRFMDYADRRGLFAGYADRDEILLTYRNIGRRMRRRNPLDRVDEIWDEFYPVLCRLFSDWFPELDAEVRRVVAGRAPD